MIIGTNCVQLLQAKFPPLATFLLNALNLPARIKESGLDKSQIAKFSLDDILASDYNNGRWSRTGANNFRGYYAEGIRFRNSCRVSKIPVWFVYQVHQFSR